MSLTLSEATADVRNLLNEPSAVFWTDAEIQDWIKEGTRIISSKALCVEDQDAITLVADQLKYSSSDETFIGDILEPYAAMYYDDNTSFRALIKIHPRNLGNVATFTAGRPKYYFLHNRRIYVWPLTTATEVTASGTIDLLYSKETDDITELPDEFQHLAIMYSQARAKSKDQKFAESGALLQQFFTELNFERQDKFEREVDTDQSMKRG